MTVLMFIFSKCSSFNFFGQVWSQNVATTVSKDCYNCCMPNFLFAKITRIRFLKLRPLDLTNARIHSMYSSKTEVRPWRNDLKYNRHSSRLTIQSYTFSKEFGEGNRALMAHMHPMLYLWKKPRVWFALAKCNKSNCGKVIFQKKMQVNGLHLLIWFFSHIALI